jgi:hypothetical protein
MPIRVGTRLIAVGVPRFFGKQVGVPELEGCRAGKAKALLRNFPVGIFCIDASTRAQSAGCS